MGGHQREQVDCRRSKGVTEDFSHEKAARAAFKEVLTKLKGSVLASNEFAEKLVESDKALEAARTKMTFLKEEVVRAHREKTEVGEKVPEVRKEQVQRRGRLNVANIVLNWAEKLTRSLVTESVSVVDAVVQQLGHYGVD